MKFTEEDLILKEEVREKVLERTEVLEKVKEIVTLPNTELMTSKMVSEYFEVGAEAIKSIFSRNRSELEKNGAKTLRSTELRNLKTEVQDATLLGRANAVTVFSSRAVLNVAMLLTESHIAEEVRNQILNQQETMTTEQKVAGIDEERELLMNILMAEGQTEQAIAVSNLNIYHKRHKAELNKRINEMKPKEESFDTFISTDGYQSMNDIAKSIGYGRNKLYQFLRDNKVLMKNNTPYQRYVNQGWFVVKQGTVVKENFQKNYAQTYVTAKGVDGITKMLKKMGNID